MLLHMPRTNHKQESKQQHKKDRDRIPNIYWRSISTEQLRCEDRFVALPTVANLPCTNEPVTYRFVRQDSMLWRELHDGMLTTGRLKQALGMHEPRAAAVLGIHPGSRGSSHLLSAYLHLLQTAGSSSSSQFSSESNSNSSNSSSSTAAAASAALNEAARRQFNEQLAADGAAAGRPAGAPAGTTSSQVSAPPELQASCQRAALAGDIAVKLAWGKVQEAAALYCLMQLFPHATVEEVGLFALDPSDLPAAWGIEPSGKNLPRLGASPDGLIVHKVTLLPDDLQAAAADLAQATDDQQAAQAVQQLLGKALSWVLCTGSRPCGVPLASSSEDGSDAETEGASAAAASSGIDTTGVSGSDAAVEEEGAAAGATTLAATAAGSIDSSSSSSGTTDSTHDVPSLQMDKLFISSAGATSISAAAAASSGGVQGVPAAAAAASSTPQSCSSGAGSLAFEPVGEALLQLLHSLQQQSNSCSSSRPQQGEAPAQEHLEVAAATTSSSSSGSSMQPLSLFVREVVEVKNHCPFAFRSKRKGSKGRVHVSYGFQGRGPAQRVHPQWVPQLQLHMLATGCQSALLVSRCADRGVRVFRIWRDEQYLQTMMQLLAVLQTQHVLQGVQPTAATFSSIPSYAAFLRRTASLARSAVCIAAAGEEVTAKVPAAADGSNVERFW